MSCLSLASSVLQSRVQYMWHEAWECWSQVQCSIFCLMNSLHFFCWLAAQKWFGQCGWDFSDNIFWEGKDACKFFPSACELDAWCWTDFNKRVQMRETLGSWILYRLYWKHLKTHVASIRCGVAVDKYPSGFKIPSVLTQHLVHDSFNIDTTPNATFQVLILKIYRNIYIKIGTLSR